MSTPNPRNSSRRGGKGTSLGERFIRLNVEHLEDRSLPSAANSAFVSQLYMTVLNRPADAGGLAAWTAALDAGTVTQAQVAHDFMTSPEFYTDLVTGYYQTYLGRARTRAG